MRSLYRAMAVIGAAILVWGGMGRAQAQAVLPHLTAVTPAGGQRGTTVTLTITGTNVDPATELRFEGAGLQVESLTGETSPPPAPVVKSADVKSADAPKKKTAGKLTARVRIAPDAEPGIRAMRLLTPAGPSDLGRFVVGQWPEVDEREPNNTREQAQEIRFPVTINGQVTPAEDPDTYRFHARKGQTLVFDILAARMESPLDPILSIEDAQGRELALNDDTNGVDSLLLFTVPADGDYFVVVRDTRSQGGANYVYRLTAGEIPYVTSVFPTAGRPGERLQLALNGVNLGGARTASVTLPADAAPGLRAVTLALPNGVSNPVTLAVTGAPVVAEVEPNDEPSKAQLLPIPGAVSGRIYSPKVAQAAQHVSTTGQAAQPAGAGAEPLDGPADADCYRFRATKDQKLILEVTARRYGSELDSLLVVTDATGKEVAVNDDGVGVGKDSRLEFTPPETGEYVARITDLQERQGPNFTYQFSITPAAPDFVLTYTPDRLAVGPGGRSLITVAVQRFYDFDSEITLTAEGLPEGMSFVGPARIRSGQKEVNVVVTAAPGAAPRATPLRVIGTATIAGKPVQRAAQGLETYTTPNGPQTRPSKLLLAAVSSPPDILITTASNAITLVRGKTATLTVKVERKNGYKGKVPVALIGLPDGVTATALDIAEDKPEGTITLQAEGKAALAETEILVAGRTIVENQRSEPELAPPITVKVVAAEKAEPAKSDAK